MIKNSEPRFREAINRQGARALVSALIEFLDANEIPRRWIVDSVCDYYKRGRKTAGTRRYRKLARAYEDMGIVMSTWFSMPRFLDRDFRPLPITIGPGPRSVASLVRAARVSIPASIAAELMRRSPSVVFDAAGNFLAQRREFVLPNFAVPRAALVIERYLDTLSRNSSSNKDKSVLLLERNCHVPEVNLNTIAPVLRDIKRRGSAYIDAVNGDLEELRKKRSRRKGSGEMSVHIFAWTRLTGRRNANGTN